MLMSVWVMTRVHPRLWFCGASHAICPLPSPPISDYGTTTLADMYLRKACPAQLFCPTGQATTPTLGTNACPLGSYCPQATPYPLLCDPGSFANVTGLAACLPCPAGGARRHGACV